MCRLSSERRIPAPGETSLRTLRLSAFVRTGGRVGEFLAKALRRKVREGRCGKPEP
jgi:hypothetical protein